jgi:hypothetical protein
VLLKNNEMALSSRKTIKCHEEAFYHRGLSLPIYFPMEKGIFSFRRPFAFELAGFYG